MSRLSDLEAVAESAAACTACELYRDATQVVFGAGPVPAALMLIGEQPGDTEDLEGEPFVGPAGAELRRAMADADIDPGAVYMTNAVKHFRWVARGKRRLHQQPKRSHVLACRPWLDAEIELVSPRVIVCLGSVASKAILGRGVRVTIDRGVPQEWGEITVIITYHPSAILRSGDQERLKLHEMLVADLRMAGGLAAARVSRGRD